MKKRIISILFIAMICAVNVLCFTTTTTYISATQKNEIPEERQLPRLVDDADLLSDSEEEQLLTRLDQISEQQKCDVAIVTINELENTSATAYADDFFDYNGYGIGSNKDGILLLISKTDRDWAISTHGSGINAFTDAGQEYMVDTFKPYLSDNKYYKAFDKFASLCDEFLTQAATGTPFDNGNLPRGMFELGKNLLFSVGFGLLAAIIVIIVMALKLKSVGQQSTATDYIRQDSLEITKSHEIFLYNTVSRTKKESESSSGSSTHTSSSGETHGGSSGSF